MTAFGPTALARYLTNQSGAASFTGEWIECPSGALLIFQVSWAAAVGCAGTLGIDGTQDPAKAAANVIALPALTAGIYGAWPTIGATASTAAAFLKNGFAFQRLNVTITGAGAANQFQAWRELRPTVG